IVASPGTRPVAARNAATSSLISCRIDSAIRFPSMIFAISSSAGEIDRPRLAYDDDLDLPGVLELVLQPTGDPVAQFSHRLVVDLFGVDHDPDLPARLDREAPLDAREALRNLLQLLQALHVRLEQFAASAGPRPADRIGRRDQERLRIAMRFLVVVSLDRVQHLVRLVVPAAELPAELDV